MNEGFLSFYISYIEFCFLGPSWMYISKLLLWRLSWQKEERHGQIAGTRERGQAKTQKEGEIPEEYSIIDVV